MKALIILVIILAARSEEELSKDDKLFPVRDPTMKLDERYIKSIITLIKGCKFNYRRQDSCGSSYKENIIQMYNNVHNL